MQRSIDLDRQAASSRTSKNLALFQRQKELLDTFLKTDAITQAQHDKSLACLIEKMGIERKSL